MQTYNQISYFKNVVSTQNPSLPNILLLYTVIYVCTYYYLHLLHSVGVFLHLSFHLEVSHLVTSQWLGIGCVWNIDSTEMGKCWKSEFSHQLFFLLVQKGHHLEMENQL